MKMNRREFLFSAGAVTMLSGCRTFDLFGSPEMTFGVVTWMSLTTPNLRSGDPNSSAVRQPATIATAPVENRNSRRFMPICFLSP